MSPYHSLRIPAAPRVVHSRGKVEAICIDRTTKWGNPFRPRLAAAIKRGDDLGVQMGPITEATR